MANLKVELGRSGGPWTFRLVPDPNFGTLNLTTSTIDFSVYPIKSTTAAFTLTQLSSTVTVSNAEKTILIYWKPDTTALLSAGTCRYVLKVTTADGHVPQLNEGGSGVITVTDPRLP